MSDKPGLLARRLPLIAGIVFAVVFIVPWCSFQVRYGEQAIKTTFGKTSGAPIGPGLHFKLPWPIQKVYTFNTALNTFRTRFAEHYTKDQQNIALTTFAAWRIADPAVFLEKVVSREEAERLLGDLIASRRGDVVNRHPLADFVHAGADPAAFEAIENEILASVAPRARESGIEVAMIGIERLALPESVTDNVLDRMAQERTTEADRIRNEGEARASEIRAAAVEQSGTILAESARRVTTIRGEAQTAAADAYDVFKQDPGLALFLRQLEVLNSLTEEKTTLILDRNVVPFNLLAPQPVPTE